MNITEYSFIKKIAALPFIDQIWLYGSRARGDERERSDFDLAIVCPEAADDNWSQVLRIIEDADTLLKIDCVRVDLLNKNLPFYNNILQDHKVIYNRIEGFMGERRLQDYFLRLGEALKRLEETLSSPLIDKDSNYHDAAIQRFEFTLEAFWKSLRKYLMFEKIDVNSPREVLQKAYQLSWIDDERVWLDMLDDRNKTSHIYSEEEANRIFQHVRTIYFPVMKRTYDKLRTKLPKEQEKL